MHGNWGIDLNEIQVGCYNLMLSKYAKVPNSSFRGYPTDERDILGLSRENNADWKRHCPRCQELLELYNLYDWDGSIEAYYCKKENHHWIFDCSKYGAFDYCPRWYGPYPGDPVWVGKYVFYLENKAAYKKRPRNYVPTLLYCLRLFREAGKIKSAELKTQGNMIHMDRVEKLIDALKDKDREVRQKAVAELGEIKDSRAVEPLFARLYDPFIEVRRCTIEALSKIGDVRAVYPIAGTYLDADEDPDVSYVVRFIDSRKNTEEENLFLAKTILSFGPSVVEILENIVENEWREILSAHSKIRWRVALITLWLMPENQTSEFFTRLGNLFLNSWTKYDYARFLGERKDQRAITLLYDLLSDNSWPQWNQAIYDLNFYMGYETSEALNKVLGKFKEVNHPLWEKAQEVLNHPPKNLYI